jgi:DNA-binding CsgD family transcriptional regulator
MDDRADAPLHRLSQREQEILGLLANGWSNRRIAEECFLSLNTVRTHVQNILVKLGVHSKLEAVAFALEHGWAPAAEDPDELAIEQLEGSRVVAAMRELSPDQREVLLLRMAGGLTAPEVAAILGKTTNAVKAPPTPSRRSSTAAWPAWKGCWASVACGRRRNARTTPITWRVKRTSKGEDGPTKPARKPVLTRCSTPKAAEPQGPLHRAQARWGPGRPSSTTKLASVRTGAPGRCTVSTTRRSVLQRRRSATQRR